MRLNKGCTNAQTLWSEIQAQGFPGTRDPVARWLQRQRHQPAPTTPTKYLPTLRLAASAVKDDEQHDDEPQVTTAPAPLPSAYRLAWLLTRPLDTLTTSERQALHYICQEPQVEQSYHLA